MSTIYLVKSFFNWNLILSSLLLSDDKWFKNLYKIPTRRCRRTSSACWSRPSVAEKLTALISKAGTFLFNKTNSPFHPGLSTTAWRTWAPKTPGRRGEYPASSAPQAFFWSRSCKVFICVNFLFTKQRITKLMLFKTLAKNLHLFFLK